MFKNIQLDGIKIGAFNAKDLVRDHGSPLLAYDKGMLQEKISLFKGIFQSSLFETEILFASKSASIIGLYKVFQQSGLSFDVVSAGEIYVALQAGIDPSKIYFHGNNKTDEELLFAFKNKVGTIIVDNWNELNKINNLSKELQQKISILLRVNPHITAGANIKIQTSNDDSKFGVSIHEDFSHLVKTLDDNDLIQFKGFHSHIGSQILSLKPYECLADELTLFAKKINQKYSLEFDTLNFGGGFGVNYTSENFDLSSFLKGYIKCIEQKIQNNSPFIKRVLIEPGRSLISESGMTLYTIGGFKKTSSGKTHLYVDGGMTDNIRPSLYDAEYTFHLDKKNENLVYNYIISGKCCESGDILSHNYSLQSKPEIGDILVAFSTGAYTFSMASNYNQLRKPKVILVDDKVTTIVRRETYEDLIRNM